MPSQQLPLFPGTLPVGACYSDEQARLNAYMQVSYALLANGQTFYNIGPDKPSVANQGYPWYNTSTGLWYFFLGVWKAKIVGWSPFDRRLFTGTPTDLITYDGGDNGTPSSESGPTWEVDSDFEGRAIMGPGDIPASSPSKTLGLGEAYGSGSHVITQAELPTISLSFRAFVGDDSSGGDFPNVPHNSSSSNDVFNVDPSPLGSGTAMSLVPPVRGIYVIKRTSRIYYTVL